MFRWILWKNIQKYFHQLTAQSLLVPPNCQWRNSWPKVSVLFRFSACHCVPTWLMVWYGPTNPLLMLISKWKIRGKRRKNCPMLIPHGVVCSFHHLGVPYNIYLLTSVHYSLLCRFPSCFLVTFFTVHIYFCYTKNLRNYYMRREWDKVWNQSSLLQNVMHMIVWETCVKPEWLNVADSLVYIIKIAFHW